MADLKELVEVGKFAKDVLQGVPSPVYDKKANKLLSDTLDKIQEQVKPIPKSKKPEKEKKDEGKTGKADT